MKSLMAILVVLFCLPVGLFGQEGDLWSGLVLDASSALPVADARIEVLPEGRVAFADSSGRFAVRLGRESREIRVSHLGYGTVLLRLEGLGKDGVVYLVPEPVELPTEVITAPGLELAFVEERKHVYDYDFLGGDLLLLIHEKGQKAPVLALVDGEGEVVLRHPGLPERGGSIFRDAFGKRHVLSANFAFQVIYDGEDLLLYQDSLATFEEWVRPCIGRIGDFIYFQRSVNDYLKAFYLYDRALKEYNSFAFVSADKELGEILDERIWKEKKLNTVYIDPMREAYLENLDYAFARQFIYPPLNSQLRIIRDRVRIFDHSAGRILSFNPDGSPCLQVVPVSYHTEKGWAQKVITDEEQEQAYTWFLRQGRPRLFRINLATGALEGGWDLEKRFVDKIRVRDGVAYFLYRDEYGASDTRRLYRLVLD